MGVHFVSGRVSEPCKTIGTVSESTFHQFNAGDSPVFLPTKLQLAAGESVWGGLELGMSGSNCNGAIIRVLSVTADSDCDACTSSDSVSTEDKFFYVPAGFELKLPPEFLWAELEIGLITSLSLPAGLTLPEDLATDFATIQGNSATALETSSRGEFFTISTLRPKFCPECEVLVPTP